MGEVLPVGSVRVPYDTRVHADGDIPERGVGDPRSIVAGPGEEQYPTGSQHRRVDGEHLGIEAEDLPVAVNGRRLGQANGRVEAGAAGGRMVARNNDESGLAA